MRAVVFINYNIAPFNAGHVGWGFEIEPGYFCYGAKEAVGMQEVALPGYPNGAFVAVGTEQEMLAAMKTGDHPGNGFIYNDYKYVAVASFNVAAASDLARQCHHWGYTVVGNNCMDDVYRIIKAYANGDGNVLPRPLAHPRPVDFFEAAGQSTSRAKIAEGRWAGLGRRDACPEIESLAKPETSDTITGVANWPRPRGLHSGTEFSEGFSVNRKTSKRSFIEGFLPLGFVRPGNGCTPKAPSARAPPVQRALQRRRADFDSCSAKLPERGLTGTAIRGKVERFPSTSR